MKPYFLFIIAALCISQRICAQDKSSSNFTDISAQDFEFPQSPVVNKNTNAVILSDSGSISFATNKNDWKITCIFSRKLKIRIFDKNAFDLATVKIDLFGKDDTKDKLEDIKASTFNLENGKLVETLLNNNDVFEVSLQKYESEKRFTMPDVKEGSVVEYSYTIKTYDVFNLPSWRFQHEEYPCLQSVFQISAPEILNYTVERTGIDSVSVVSSENETDHFEMKDSEFKSVIHKRTWTIKDVAAFKEEPFIDVHDDYIDALNFRLRNLYHLSKDIQVLTWKDITKGLLANESFGEAISVDKAAFLFNTMQRITSADKNLLDAAKHIFEYVRDNFLCIESDDIFAHHDMYDVNKRRKGTVAELNLLLTALLKQKGLLADPVILSTRSYGSHPADHPALEKMNYVLCRLKIFGDTIYLDASKPHLGFGKLTLDCYNGHARIISDKDSGDVYFYPGSVKELTSTTVFIENDEKENGSMAGNLQTIPGYHNSYKVRLQLKEGTNNFFSERQRLYGREITILNAGIDSLKRLDDLIKIHYDFKTKIDNGEDIVYFNPILTDEYKINPFTAAERKYPIEMPAPIDNIYVFNMEIPKGFAIDELPKSARVNFNDKEGFYEYIIQAEDNNIQLRSRIKLDRAYFEADEYNILRDFFAFVVKKQSEQIVFKRKKG